MRGRPERNLRRSPSGPERLSRSRRPPPGRRGGPWLEYADVRQAGFDPEALRAVCTHADSLRSGALMVVFRRHVILACGDVERRFETHSMRKSLVSGL